jgi:hypothetical protein
MQKTIIAQVSHIPRLQLGYQYSVSPVCLIGDKRVDLKLMTGVEIRGLSRNETDWARIQPLVVQDVMTNHHAAENHTTVWSTRFSAYFAE